MLRNAVRSRDWVGACVVIVLVLPPLSAPAAQTLPNQLLGQSQSDNPPTPRPRPSIRSWEVLQQREPAGPRPDENAAAAAPQDAVLRREQFRREAAEAALKHLEQMADQLREQLGKEVTARRAAEAVASDLLSRASLEDQIERERERLRDSRVRLLEKRGAMLENKVKVLTQRLADESARREQLEAENAALAKSATTPASATDIAETETLKLQIKSLERRLAAAEWARKLAEAQLKVVSEKATRQ